MLYDETDPKSIESYAKKLIGKTFRDVLNNAQSVQEEEIGYGNKARKGGLGNLLEEVYFKYKANSDSRADFHEAGVELKATPYKTIKARGKKNAGIVEYRAGERLVLTMIENNQPVEEDFYNSHLWEKCRLLLLIFYLRDKSLASNLDYIIDFVKLFTPDENDLRIITEDYDTIINKIKMGNAHLLSEGDTRYLGACTKGATAASSVASQYYSDIPAKRRAFSFKTSYMSYVLNHYILGLTDGEESIIAANQNKYHSRADIVEDFSRGKIDFDTYIIKLIDYYKGKTDEELAQLLNSNQKVSKAFWICIVYRMLGISSNAAAEFSKAGIVAKAIRVEENNTIRESSPLPTTDFMEMVGENWEDSELADYLERTRFLFVVFKKEGEHYVLKGAKFFNLPVADIEKASELWLKIKDMLINDTLKFTPVEQKGGVVIKNNLPKKSANPIIHMRPHAQKSFYVLKDGSTYGSGSLADTCQLPNGERMTTQSFWLNNTYVFDAIKELLK